MPEQAHNLHEHSYIAIHSYKQGNTKQNATQKSHVHNKKLYSMQHTLYKLKANEQKIVINVRMVRMLSNKL